MAIVLIDYDDFDASTYESIRIIHNSEVKIFDSGNFIVDWYNHVLYVVENFVEQGVLVMNGSSVNHFIMDMKDFSCGVLLVENDVPTLYYGDDMEIKKSGIEFFVPKEQMWSWDELVSFCKSANKSKK